MKMRACIWMFAVLCCISVTAKPTKSSIGARNGVGGSGNALPYDAEVEYLESTGTQIVDTGYVPQMGDVISFPANAMSVTAGCIDGAISSTTKRLHGFNVINSVFIGGSGYDLRTSGGQWAYGSEWEIDLEHFTLSFGGATVPIKTDISLPTTTFSFMARHNNMSSPTYDNYKAGSRFRRFRVTRNGVVVVDGIPVRFTNELGQSEGAMYDRVSGQLFRNQGTGAFLIGPDK